MDTFTFYIHFLLILCTMTLTCYIIGIMIVIECFSSLETFLFFDLFNFSSLGDLCVGIEEFMQNCLFWDENSFIFLTFSCYVILSFVHHWYRQNKTKLSLIINEKSKWFQIYFIKLNVGRRVGIKINWSFVFYYTAIKNN